MLAIIEKSIKILQNSVVLERKLCLVLAQNAPKLKSLRFVDYVII